MELSEDQTNAAYASVRGYTWEPIERPEGPQPLPAWIRDAHVDWNDQYSNAPSYDLRVTEGAEDWNGVRWKAHPGGFYRLEHWDGRMRQYKHTGAVSVRPMRRWRRHDGTIFQYAPHGDFGKRDESIPYNSKNIDDMTAYPDRKGDFVYIDMRCTEKQDGFGGAQIELDMDDGEKLVLWGPWHVVGPAGYTEVHFHRAGEPAQPWQARLKHKWWQRGGTFGHWIRNDVFLAIMCRFEAHLEWAEVRKPHVPGKAYLEPIRPERGMPKTIYKEIDWLATNERLKAEREAKKAAEAAAVK